ncbi:hypothetical protein Cylst_5896 [Cylindrospermum stagnale PCC 7417]|uniref:Uncharacterized protein n=1 Tax=Cylindrospermum stagnale PCC 7417 TaxID=56107 RepID=K9X5V1_9NOST|nr:SUMF1/EgtB/PvdO family nonheme iron enzyme [Cylindrospermum stagnale]AFZ27873.1 hypothetical protein Cylst_5896 [Cylindrospermum stagnale PCC 7417]
MRADFLEYALANRDFFGALAGEFPDPKGEKGAICLLGPMNRQELQDVIEKPAANLVQLQEGLCDRILQAVEKQPGNLPLLEFALTQLWKQQSQGQLTHQAYDHIGGVEKALARYAQEQYQQLSPTDQERTKRVFIQLVRPGEGTEDTRRLATRAEVGENNWDLVTKLANFRLVVTGRDETAKEETVEVIHEALIREWQQLRDWMEDQRRFRTWQERLRMTMRQWDAAGKDEKALLQGVLLVEAEDWQQQRLEELSLDERAFIQLSLALRDRQKQEQEQIQQRELALMRQSRTRLRSPVVVLGAIAFGTSTVLVYPRILGWWTASQSPMVRMPAGDAVIGTNPIKANPQEMPERTVYVREFQLEQYEVSNQQYQLCVKAGVCTEPITQLPLYSNNQNLQHPVIGITAIQAAKYCHWLGRRLPTEVEWERSARGLKLPEKPKGRLWPWGDLDPFPQLANLLFSQAENDLQPVKNYDDGASPEKVYNLVGNAWE